MRSRFRLVMKVWVVVWLKCFVCVEKFMWLRKIIVRVYYSDV